VEPLKADDHYDGDVFVDGRLAFYLKGKIKGRYLVTAQLDTTEDELDEIFKGLHRKDPRSAFRHLDPDRYYPVYGDDSTTISDVDSQGRFYIRVDWDQSRALWGNFNTSFTGTEFARYNRTLYGASLDYRSPETTRYGEHRVEVKAFGSEAQTALGHNEFLGTGGSLYYLRNTGIVEGSAKVWVEIRERDTNRVLENVTLELGRDYEIDELQGRIILRRPLTEVERSTAPAIIKSEPLDGDRVLLMVDYEYVPDDFDSDKVSAGARAKGWVNDQVAVGGTYVRENRDGTDYELKGVDVTLRQGEGTYVRMEYAESESQQTLDSYFSDNGGIRFDSISTGVESADGKAWGIEARGNLTELTAGSQEGIVAAWYKHRDAGFSVAQLADGADTEEYGVEANWQARADLAIAARAAVIDREDELEQRSLSVQADYWLNERWRLGGELRYERQAVADEDPVAGTLAGVQVGYRLSPNAEIYGALQGTLNRDDGYEANDLVTLGARAQVGSQLSLTAEASTGSRGDGVLIGADYQLSTTHTLYGTYTLSTDRDDEPRGVMTMGQRRDMGNGLRVFSENQFIHSDREAGIAHVYGLDFRPTEQLSLGSTYQKSRLDGDDGRFDRDAVSLFGRWQTGPVDLFGKLEYRRDEGEVDQHQWLTTNRGQYVLNDEFTLLGKFSYSYTKDRSASRKLARFSETSMGLAYRPIADDRLNLLGKYTYLYDLDSIGQADPGNDQKSHVLSGEAIYALDQVWELGGKLAWKRGEEREGRDQGRWFETEATLAVARARYHWIKNWDALAEYRWLKVDEAEDRKQGFALSLYRHVGGNLKLGVGYNFTDFDDDITNLDYDNHGWFINLIGKY
jgi:hypothetical protein